MYKPYKLGVHTAIPTPVIPTPAIPNPKPKPNPIVSIASVGKAGAPHELVLAAVRVTMAHKRAAVQPSPTVVATKCVCNPFESLLPLIKCRCTCCIP